MHPELELLQAENRRLSALVAALAEKNLRLEEALAQATASGRPAVEPEMTVTGPNEPVRRQDQSVRFPDDSVRRQDQSVYVPDVSVQRKDESVHSPALTVQRKDESVRLEDKSVHRKDQSVRLPDMHAQGQEPFVSFPKESVNGKEIPAAYEPPAPGKELLALNLGGAWRQFSAEAQHRARLHRVYTAGLSPSAVATALKGGPMAGCLDRHCLRAAQLLLWLCGQPPGRIHYDAICAQTGLTYSGVGKPVLSLKKHGVLRRKAYQVYEPTEDVLQALEGMIPRV